MIGFIVKKCTNRVTSIVSIFRSKSQTQGDLAQLVECSLSMREVIDSLDASSTCFLALHFIIIRFDV